MTRTRLSLTGSILFRNFIHVASHWLWKLHCKYFVPQTPYHVVSAFQKHSFLCVFSGDSCKKIEKWLLVFKRAIDEMTSIYLQKKMLSSFNRSKWFMDCAEANLLPLNMTQDLFFAVSYCSCCSHAHKNQNKTFI